ncbi:hypothetical protein Tco_0468330 [Tanacetum coccineum]
MSMTVVMYCWVMAGNALYGGRVEDPDGIQQHNGLVEKTNVTLLAKCKCLQGVEVEVEPQEDHTFEVEPQGNGSHVVGSPEVQTQDLIDYHSTLAEVEKIYVHESLTFNDTVACEVISKRKARLKKDMDARSDMHVLSNGCKEKQYAQQWMLVQICMCSAMVARKSSNDSVGYYWEYTPARRVHTSNLSI